MHRTTKVATCCYCGTRAALVLTGRDRHELSCSACGAPLHDLKMLPKSKVGKGERDLVDRSAYRQPNPRKPKKSKKKKRISTASWLFEELGDLVEEIFD